MFLSSSIALDMLQTCAPRAWCKRMLCWEIFSGGLDLFARDGEITRRHSAYQILEDAGIKYEDRATLNDEAILALGQDTEGADTLRKAAASQTPYQLIPVNVDHWSIHDGPLPNALIIALEYLDFDTETLNGDYNGWLPNDWMESSEVFEVQGQEDILVSLVGLSFETAKIEMLVPSASVPATSRQHNDTKDRTFSRSSKWDWEGAMANIVAEANRNPDGLPEGFGALASIEKMLATWFLNSTGKSPAESEVRRRAHRIMEALKRG